MLAITLGIFTLVSCNNDDNNDPIINEDPVMPHMFSIYAEGNATGEFIEDYELPGTDQVVSGNAFTMPIYNPVTQQQTGTVIDINVQAISHEDGSMFGENYTVFLFEDTYNSSLVLHNFIEMIPESPTLMNAFIKTDNTKNNVISGTGLFAEFSGGATLNALLDMTNFGENTIGFKCLYGLTYMP